MFFHKPSIAQITFKNSVSPDSLSPAAVPPTASPVSASHPMAIPVRPAPRFRTYGASPEAKMGSAAISPPIPAKPIQLPQPGKAMGSGERMSIEHEFFTYIKKTHDLGRKDGVLFQWKQNHWKVLEEEECFTLVCKWIEAHHLERATDATAKNCIAWLIRMVPLVPAMDPARCIIPLIDGYLEVMSDGKTIRRLSPDPALGMTYALKIAAGFGSTDYVPAPVAPNSLFGRFLNTSMPDVDNQAYLQELMGYTLCSSTEHQVAIILKGGGQNGKSVLMRLATSLQGNPQSIRLDRLSGFGLSSLVGASMLVAEEMPARGIDEQTFKAIASGEGLSIDRKYRSPITYHNTAKLLIATNLDLRSSDNSHGLWRRQAIISFDHQIDQSQVIPGLAGKIIAQELKLYLDWCLLGLQRLMQRSRLPDPTASMVKAKRSAILASDPVARWVDEQSVKVSGSALICKADVFEAYAKWCRANGERAGNSSAFWKSVASHLEGMKSSQARMSGQRHYVVNLRLGVGLDMDTLTQDNPFGDSEA